MKRKTAAQLDAEIATALREGRTPPPAPAAAWKRLIADIQRRARTTVGAEARAALQAELDAAYDGMRASQKVAAHKPGFVTDTNLFALKEMIVEAGGPTFSNRVSSTRASHLKRTMQAGLLEVASPTTVRLTPAGREAVADLLIADISRLSAYTPRVNEFVPRDKQAEVLERDKAEHRRKIEKLEKTLAAIR